MFPKEAVMFLYLIFKYILNKTIFTLTIFYSVYYFKDVKGSLMMNEF